MNIIINESIKEDVERDIQDPQPQAAIIRTTLIIAIANGQRGEIECGLYL